MLTLRWLASVLFVVCIPLFIVLGVVRVAANWEVPYSYSYSQYDVPEVSGIARSELDRATREIIWYFQSAPSNQLLDIRVDQDGELRPLFNQREIIHMQDVQHLFRLVFRIHDIVFAYMIAYVAAVYLWSRERSMRRLAQQAIVGGTATVALLGVTAVAIVVGFDDLWVQFHLISFSNDFWRLNPATDHLIQMFPTSFWFDATLAIGVVSMMLGGLVALTGVAYVTWVDRTQRARRRARRRRSASAVEAGPGA